MWSLLHHSVANSVCSHHHETGYRVHRKENIWKTLFHRILKNPVSSVRPIRWLDRRGEPDGTPARRHHCRGSLISAKSENLLVYTMQGFWEDSAATAEFSAYSTLAIIYSIYNSLNFGYLCRYISCSTSVGAQHTV